jgi:hypothetical protein
MLQSLSKPTNGRASCFRKPYEAQLYDAFKGQWDASAALAAKELYHDAWLNLNLAVECFLKYAFCIVREHLITRAALQPQQDEGPFDYEAASGFLFVKREIFAKDLEHDVVGLWGFFKRFTDANSSPHFASLIYDIPTRKEWIDRRYEARNHTNYRPKYIYYRRSFGRVLRSCFGRIA